MVVGVCAHMYKVQNTYIAIMVHGYIDYKQEYIRDKSVQLRTSRV